MSEAGEAGKVEGAEPSVLQALGDGVCTELDAERGFAALRFTVRPEFCHSGGVAQGGFVTGWIDSAMAHAVLAQRGQQFWIATLEIKISFFRPAGPGKVRAEGWIERAGKQTVFCEGRLLDMAGEVLAKGSSTIRLVPRRRPFKLRSSTPRCGPPAAGARRTWPACPVAAPG